VTGLYSPINRLMEQVTRPKGTGAEYMAELAKKPGYKPAEAQDRDLQTLMALPQMERATFMERLKNKKNKFPLKQRELTGTQTHHETYTLPGGENYREILLHTPMPEGEGFPGVEYHFGGTPNVIASIRAKDRISPEGKKILHLEEIQSDWHQQGREKGYEDAHNKKQIEEISAQRAKLHDEWLAKSEELRLKNDPKPYIALAPITNQMRALWDQMSKLEEEPAIPYGPHAKDWHELALKAMIQHAAEKGYDQIAITPGAEQAKRYELSKHVGRITHMTHHDDPDSGILFAFDPKGNQIVEKHNVPHSQLPQYIGKEGARKLLEQKPDEHGYRELKDQDLEFGGEGMKGFYDKMVPAFLNKFGKKHGVQVQQGQVATAGSANPVTGGEIAEAMGYPFREFINLPNRAQLEKQYWDNQKTYTTPVHTFDITPGMREDVLKNGIPRYAEGGEVGEDVPRETTKAYKLFRVHPKHPGKLFPLFVDSNTPVEMNKWIAAKEGEMANGKVKSKIGPLAYRPGWHAGDLPIATHIGEKSDPSLTAPDVRPENHAWAEVEMPNDVDWQAEATKRGTNAQGKLIPVKAHITDQLPVGGHYRYKTNPNMTGNWLIGGSMKVNRVLTDKEVAKINKAAGLADLPRAKPFNAKKFGFAKGGSVGPEEFMAEEHVNYKVLPQKERDANLAKFLEPSKEKRRMYHGTRHYTRGVKGGHPATSPEADPNYTEKMRNTGGFASITPGIRGMSFVTPDTEFANEYAGENKKADKMSGAVYPVHVQVKNPFDYENPAHVAKVAEALKPTDNIWAMHHGKPLDYIKDRLASGDWAWIEDPDVMAAAKSLGHDAMYMKEMGVKNLGVFNPNAIKSAIGNRGTYDINEPHMNKATGGVVKEKVTISPNMDVMQYELITKKVK